MAIKKLALNLTQKTKSLSIRIEEKLKQPRYSFWRGLVCGVFLVFVLHAVVTLYKFQLVYAYAEKFELSKHIESQVSKDVAFVSKCASANSPSGTFVYNDISKETRTCIISAAPEIASWVGAIAISSRVSEYLLAHPADTELTNAAAMAITKARADLASKAPFYELESDAYRAYANGPEFPFMPAPSDISYINGEHFKSMLDAAELGIFAPGVALTKSVGELCTHAPAAVCKRNQAYYQWRDGRVVGLNKSDVSP